MMIKVFGLFSILFYVFNSNLFGQWIQGNGEYANSHVMRFIVADSKLIAGCAEGVIFYNSVNDTWNEKVATGMVVDLVAYDGEIYVVNAANQIKVISKSKEIKNIPFHPEQFDIKSIRQIFVYNNRLYLGGYKGVFYQSLGDTVWYKMNVEKNIPIPLGIKKIIEFQGNILALSKDGILISFNGTSFTKLIRNDNILQFGTISTKPIKSNETESYKLKSIESQAETLFTYSGRKIFFTKNLVTWEKYMSTGEVLQVKPICCCYGIMLNTIDALYYSFKTNNLIKIPPLPKNGNEISSPNDYCIFNDKIYASILQTEHNGIYYLNFNYSLKF